MIFLFHFPWGYRNFKKKKTLRVFYFSNYKLYVAQHFTNSTKTLIPFFLGLWFEIKERKWLYFDDRERNSRLIPITIIKEFMLVSNGSIHWWKFNLSIFFTLKYLEKVDLIFGKIWVSGSPFVLGLIYFIVWRHKGVYVDL